MASGRRLQAPVPRRVTHGVVCRGLPGQRRKWGSERRLDPGPRGTGARGGGVGSHPGKKSPGNSVPAQGTPVTAQRPPSWGLSQPWPHRRGNPGLEVKSLGRVTQRVSMVQTQAPAASGRRVQGRPGSRARACDRVSSVARGVLSGGKGGAGAGPGLVAGRKCAPDLSLRTACQATHGTACKENPKTFFQELWTLVPPVRSHVSGPALCK